jgi:hypothetical protein
MRPFVLVALFVSFAGGGAYAQTAVSSSAVVDLADFRSGTDIAVDHDSVRLRLRWRITAEEFGALTLNLERARPLIEVLGVDRAGEPSRDILQKVNPVVLLTVGERDLKNPAGWMAFFDNPPLRAYRSHAMVIDKKRVRVTGGAQRATISVSDVTVGSFRGRFEFTVYRNSPLVLAEAVVATEEDGRAILYDAGLVTPVPNTTGLDIPLPNWRSIAWLNGDGAVHREPVDVDRVAGPVTVTRRALAAESAEGAVAVFPPPHQYFYPLDFATNLGFAWFGKSGDQWLRGYGFGVQQPPTGDKRWVPWCNAPPHTEQRLGLFYLVSRGDAGAALNEAGRYTRQDRYKKLPGHVTFSSHYHIEHAIELTKKRAAAGPPATIPEELRVPDFVKTFKARGIEIVHLAEFHVGGVPRMPAEARLPLLKTLHEECARLSDDELLVLPGEEPNVHLGGHWISFFPKPVYWVLNRAGDKPFAEQVAGYGTVYHVGSADDVLRLMEKERGLMWTAHPRIKGSRGFPDNYLDTAFYRSDRFLGGAWKSMPLDLSHPRLGSRVLDLQDDLANRGDRKYILGEVDIFRVEPGMETYAHMNINYLKLERAPRYADGWQPVLDALRGGRFFVSTGEVLIPEFSIGGKESGQVLTAVGSETAELRAKVEGTFPLSFAEIVSGDGRRVYRERIDLSDSESFGPRDIAMKIDLAGRTWARLEVWDCARNGAFTPPVWIAGGQAASTGSAGTR